jgi:hypothetical protein
MTRYARYVAGALMIGAFLFGGGTQQGNAAACTNSETLASLGAAGCTLGDKTFSNFASTAGGGEIALPGTTPIEFALINVGGVNEYTLTVSDPFTQGATYNMSYTAAITSGTNRFSSVTGGLLLAAPGGTATLTKTFSGLVGGGSLSPNPLEACAVNTVACPISNTSTVTGTLTSINTTDAFFVDTSNVTGFSNTFEQKAVPEPASLGILGVGLLGLGFIVSRKRRV